MVEITVYSSRYCPYCRRAKTLLRAKAVAFEEIDVDDDPRKRAEMIERAGGRGTVPQIFIDGRHIGGCDELMALEDEGALDGLLGL